MTDWRTLAACRGHETSIFFPHGSDTNAVAAALTICKPCPARSDCLNDAITEEGGKDLNSRHGIRGGMSESQRLREYRRRQWHAAHPKPAGKPGRPKTVTVEQRHELYDLYKEGATADMLAERYGIVPRTVKKIVAAVRVERGDEVRKKPTILTADQQARIRERYAAGEKSGALAAEFGVTTKTVQRITRAVRQQAAA